MPESVLSIPRIDDRTALAIFGELQAVQPPNSMSLQGIGLDHVNLLAPDAVANDLLSALTTGSSFLITQLVLSYQNLTIQFVRYNDANRNPFLDELRINFQQNQPGGLNQSQRLALLSLLGSKFSFSAQPSSGAAGRAIDDLQAIYQSTVLSLQASFGQQIEKITSWTVEQTTALERRKLELAEDAAAERERLSQEYEAKVEKLRHSAEELEGKRKELDDRAYMHARRGIRADLRNTIKERQQKFTLTPETRRLRTPVHVALVILLGALAAVNYATLHAILTLDLDKATTPVLIWTFGKQTIVALAFVGILLFYVRWMNRWFEQHAAAEFLLKQFELDIDRASWVVETAMEWRRDQQAEIPASLLDGITRNLFSDKNDTTQAHSAADDLASALVGNASQLKLKVGENELNFDRKGLAGLGKIET
ncbi:hypothetical protein ACQR1N_18280 [Bradyrhizobium sp. HKCCYLRH1073]|uniref:hypothetical protein n=1 Tax=unclassified Bradyrhizobium TaxID=2631580 RepID=UPI003EC055F4